MQQGAYVCPWGVTYGERGRLLAQYGGGLVSGRVRARSAAVGDPKHVEIRAFHRNCARSRTEILWTTPKNSQFRETLEVLRKPSTERHDVRRRATEPGRSTYRGRAATRRHSTHRDRSGSSPSTKFQPWRARSRSAARAAPQRPRSRASPPCGDLRLLAIAARLPRRNKGFPPKLC